MLAEGLWGDGDILFYQPSAQREERRTEENEATVHVKAKKKKNMLQENIRKPNCRGRKFRREKEL